MSKGEELEGTAFTFCKAATLVALSGKWALPVCAGGAALFYVLAYRHGKKDTRCVLRYPLLIAAFWGFIAVASLWHKLT